MNAFHLDYCFILVLLAAVLPIAGKFRVDRLLARPETPRRDRLRIYASTIVFQWLLVAFTVWRLRTHGVAFSEIGISVNLSLRLFLTTAVLVAWGATNQLISLRLLDTRPSEAQGKIAQVALRVFPRDFLERATFLLVVCTVAICEEFLFRGFVQSLFAGLLHSAWAGILISAGFFSLAHLYQGRRGIIATFIVGVIFGAARLISHSLIPCIVGHFVIDFIAGYYLPERIRQVLAQNGWLVLTEAHTVEHS